MNNLAAHIRLKYTKLWRFQWVMKINDWDLSTSNFYNKYERIFMLIYLNRRMSYSKIRVMSMSPLICYIYISLKIRVYFQGIWEFTFFFRGRRWLRLRGNLRQQIKIGFSQLCSPNYNKFSFRMMITDWCQMTRISPHIRCNWSYSLSFLCFNHTSKKSTDVHGPCFWN